MVTRATGIKNASKSRLTLIIRLIKFHAHDQISSTNSPLPPTRPAPALLRAGLRLFGRKGYEGTSTREIAALAKANIGSIAYHFGGKEGLHLACADFIVETIQAHRAARRSAKQRPRSEAETAAEGLKQSIERIVAFFVASPEVGDFVQFVLRELSLPSAALDRHLHRRVRADPCAALPRLGNRRQASLLKAKRPRSACSC